MNGFEKHGLKHTSPSQLNMWADAPCAWVSQYLFGNKSTFGVAPQIGVLVEKVVVDVLMGEDLEFILDKAKSKFLHDNALNISERDLARVEDIEPMAVNALQELEQYGLPEFEGNKLTGWKQKEIALVCKGQDWELPVKGFIDLHYPQHGLVVDLKTTLRMPSKMSDSHKRQSAIYRQAMGNCAVKFLYVTPKKATWHEVADQAETLAEFKTILTRQEAFLRLGDKETLRSIVPVNKESFYWLGQEATRKELYGI
jgi:hypothetical protein